MAPLIAEYKKHFTPGISDANEIKAAKNKIKEVLSKQMPVDKGLLSMAVRCLPSPKKAQSQRISVFCPKLDSLKDSIIYKCLAESD